MSVCPVGSVTGAKGLPLANRHLPFVHLNACSAVHSALDVGLDRGKITGRSQFAAMSLTISSVKAWNGIYKVTKK